VWLSTRSSLPLLLYSFVLPQYALVLSLRSGPQSCSVDVTISDCLGHYLMPRSTLLASGLPDRQTLDLISLAHGIVWYTHFHPCHEPFSPSAWSSVSYLLHRLPCSRLPAPFVSLSSSPATPWVDDHSQPHPGKHLHPLCPDWPRLRVEAE
jgi:hypothetical protein